MSFVAVYARLKKVTILFVSLYLYASEKFSDRNKNILFQVQLLLNITGFNAVIYGDFNLLPDELMHSGWVDRFKCQIFKCSRTSTLKINKTSHIDFSLFQTIWLKLLKILVLLTQSPGVPTLGLYLSCYQPL